MKKCWLFLERVVRESLSDRCLLALRKGETWIERKIRREKGEGGVEIAWAGGEKIGYKSKRKKERTAEEEQVREIE